VPVELVFDQSIGQIFVTRVAGNVTTSEIIASLEYGAALLVLSAYYNIASGEVLLLDHDTDRTMDMSG
jgi:carbonic anhydrase